MQGTKALSLKIKKICAERKISINALAMETNIPQSTLNDIVNMKLGKGPNFQTLIHLCDGLGMTLSEFFDDDELFIDLDRTDDLHIRKTEK